MQIETSMTSIQSECSTDVCGFIEIIYMTDSSNTNLDAATIVGPN